MSTILDLLAALTGAFIDTVILGKPIERQEEELGS